MRRKRRWSRLGRYRKASIIRKTPRPNEERSSACTGQEPAGHSSAYLLPRRNAVLSSCNPKRIQNLQGDSSGYLEPILSLHSCQRSSCRIIDNAIYLSRIVPKGCQHHLHLADDFPELIRVTRKDSGLRLDDRSCSWGRRGCAYGWSALRRCWSTVNWRRISLRWWAVVATCRGPMARMGAVAAVTAVRTMASVPGQREFVIELEYFEQRR